jgi:uncharacterized membrane protein YfcA
VIQFPISGIELQWWLPPLIAFVAAGLSSMAGVSGAFLLLPIQVSLLGIAGPMVSSTNLLYNIIAIPSGVYRYLREQRIIWSLVVTIILGALPGMVLGAVVRVRLMPDAATFKPFAGLVLLYLAGRLIISILRPSTGEREQTRDSQLSRVRPIGMTTKTLTFEYASHIYRASTVKALVASLAVGMVGGAYGIGGGALLAPVLVAVFRLPVHAIAGTTLLTTFLSSVVGVAVYASLGRLTGNAVPTVSPDWLLGLLFGLGGMVGMYVGARVQRLVPARYIKIILAVLILTVAVRYVATLFT